MIEEMFTNHLNALVPALIALFGGHVWLIRLEFRTKNTERDVEKMQKRQQLLEDKIYEELSLIKVSLARIDGRLSITIKQDGDTP